LTLTIRTALGAVALLLVALAVAGCDQRPTAATPANPDDAPADSGIVWNTDAAPAARAGYSPAPINPIFEQVAEFAPAFHDEAGVGIPPALAGLAIDRPGNLYVTDRSNNQVIQISVDGRIERIAGNGTRSDSGDGGPALLAGLRDPGPIVADSRFGIYVASNTLIRRIAPDGTISLLAGSSEPGSADDPDALGEARFNSISGLALDGNGVLFVADRGNNRIRRIAANGAVTTFAGTGDPATGGDGGPADLARFDGPADLAISSEGALYLSESEGHVVRRIGPDGIVSTVAGTGIPGRDGDGGPASMAQLDAPASLDVDSAGNLYVADWNNSAIRVVSAAGTISTYAGLGTAGAAQAGVPAREAVLPRPIDFQLGPDGSIYLLAQLSGKVFRMAGFGDPGSETGCRLEPLPDALPPDLPATQLAATQLFGRSGFGFSGDGGPVAAAQFAGPDSIAVGGNELFVADTGNNRLRKISAGQVETIAGAGLAAFRGDGGLARFALLAAPKTVLADSVGNVFFFDAGNFRIRRIDGCGVIETVAGNGRPGDPGTGGAALEVSLLDVVAMAMSADGSIYLADSGTDRVMRLTTDGLLETVAGNGQTGPAVEGAAPTGTSLSDPAGLALTADGSLLIAENGSGRILVIRPGTDSIGVLATELQDPGLLAAAQNGSVYVAGESAGRLDRIDSRGTHTLVDSSGTVEAVLDPVLAAPRSLALTGGQLIVLGASGAAFLIG
jgi:hypothetical protein